MPTIAKTKKDALHFANWGGMFSHPDEQAELFALLPGWRQREVLFIRDERAAGRTPTREEIAQVVRGEKRANVRINLPKRFTVASLRLHAVGEAPDASLLETIKEQVNEDSVIAHCSAFGQGQRLAGEPPVHGLYAYLWAITRVRSGLSESLPITFLWELEEGIHEMTGRKVLLKGTEAGPLLTWLDERAVRLCSTIT